MTARARRLLAALEDGCSLVPLHGKGGLVVDHALVDADNVEDLLYLRWYRTAWGYTASTFAKQWVSMHRAILDLEKGDKRQGDHVNGDRLDNRRCNLRIVTAAQNLQNVMPKGKTSRYRGVHWSKSQRCWVAQAKCDGRYFCERFDDEDEAARAVSAWRLLHMPYTNEERLP